MKNAPTVMPTSTRNLKNQKLRHIKRDSEGAVRACVQQGAEDVHGRHEPVLDRGSGVFAAAHSDHDEGEEEEEAGHGEAHTVHRLVAHDDVTVHLVLYPWYTGPPHTEAWNLEPGNHRTLIAVARLQPLFSISSRLKPDMCGQHLYRGQRSTLPFSLPPHLL